MQGPYVQKLRMHFWNWANFFSKIVVNNFVNITEPMGKLLNKLLTNNLLNKKDCTRSGKY